MEMILLDTCVLIQFLKGDNQVVTRISKINSSLTISATSVMELYYGALNKDEQKMLEQFCSKFKVIQLSADISKQSIKLIKHYAKSHCLDIPDSLIAATCMTHHLKLYTLNIKDFRFIDGLELF
ncbi:MAG: type II toxin-antitoxin system VapC family toxin [Proteobacteria bacterium]|nr:type II toxin-antitoxin system VapC family toxin [Pseudomonadota bacterium]